MFLGLWELDTMCFDHIRPCSPPAPPRPIQILLTTFGLSFPCFFYTHQVWLALTINYWLCERPLQLPSWRKLTVPLLAARLRVGLPAHLLSPCWHLGFHRSHACCHNLCEFMWMAALLSPYCHLLPLALTLLVLVSYDNNDRYFCIF